MEQREYTCFHCGLTLTEERAKSQIERTGFDKPVCCGENMIPSVINYNPITEDNVD